MDILLVEDNHGDINLIERAFEERSLPGTLHTVTTGDDALDWLYRRGEHTDVPRPDLVLLDLNLPATSGHAILEELEADPDMSRIPVLVLTGSKSQDDVQRVYETGANAYLIKPADPDRFADLLERITEFWSVFATLPTIPNSGDEVT